MIPVSLAIARCEWCGLRPSTFHVVLGASWLEFSPVCGDCYQFANACDVELCEGLTGQREYSLGDNIFRELQTACPFRRCECGECVRGGSPYPFAVFA